MPKPNPYAPARNPYPDERRVGGNLTSKLGPTMIGTEGNSSRGSTRMAWPESYGDGDDDEDGRRRLPRIPRGDGSSGTY